MQTATFLTDMCGANAFAVATTQDATTLMRDLNDRFDASMVKAEAHTGGQGCIWVRGADLVIDQPTIAIFRS